VGAVPAAVWRPDRPRLRQEAGLAGRRRGMPAQLCGQPWSAEVFGVSAPLGPMGGGWLGLVTAGVSEIVRTRIPVGGARGGWQAQRASAGTRRRQTPGAGLRRRRDAEIAVLRTLGATKPSDPSARDPPALPDRRSLRSFWALGRPIRCSAAVPVAPCGQPRTKPRFARPGQGCDSPANPLESHSNLPARRLAARCN